MKKKLFMSLDKELSFAGIIALLAAVITFLIVSVTAQHLLNKHFGSDEYYRQQDSKMIHSLEMYIDAYEVSSTDWAYINRWVMRDNVVNLTIYKDSLLVYDSQLFLDSSYTDSLEAGSAEMNTPTARIIESDYEKQTAYHVDFADGTADVIILGKYATNYYYLASVLEFVIPCIVFIAIIIFVVRRKMKYLIKLCEDVHIIEGGDLEHPVTISGHDEITTLALSIDELRKSFIQKLALIMKLQDDSRALVTEMSHDLRTPMTPLLVYLGMLREKKYSSDAEHDSYVEKSYEKASQLKYMSDNMFSYFLLDRDSDIELETVSMYDAFYDQLSGMSAYLTTSGFKTNVSINLDDVNIMVNSSFMMRIFDNIVSNILKYADKQEIITISLSHQNDKVLLHVKNNINELADHSNSTGFGVKNIKKMMDSMSAEYIIHQKESSYETFLLFRVVSSGAPA